MTAPITLDQAWAELFALVRPLGSETIPVDEAAGRWLAEDLPARRTQPERDLSAMDGYAACGPGPWRVLGEARAGHPYDGRLEAGEAVTISTGAVCPVGTEGIVLIEDALCEGSTLSAREAPSSRHIRRQGFDFAEGDGLLARGRRLGAAQVALARIAGHGAVTVSRVPRVAVIEIGDELVADPSACPPGKLPASNGAMVAAMVASVGAPVTRIGPLADDRGVLAAAIAACDADVVVTTAGASVGPHDHVRGAFADAGADLSFWRVAIRPGKPLLVARRDKQIGLGLPGNPASSYVTAFLFLLPLVRALQGAAEPLARPIALPLFAPLPEGGPRREFVRAVFEDGQARPLDQRDSSALRTLAAADLLIDRAIGAPAASAGETAWCYWLGNGGIA